MTHKPDFFDRNARKAHIRELRRGYLTKDVVPFPDVCAHPDCDQTPIVGINKRFVCPDHMKWVLKPVRDALSVVRSIFG